MAADPDAKGARLHFTRPVLKGLVTVAGSRRVVFADEVKSMGLSQADVERLQKTIGLNARQIVPGSETTVDLCNVAARQVLQGLGIAPGDVQALILVTQTPDYAAPSSAIALQHRLGMSVHSMAFDMRLGCSGFVYGLSVAYSLVQSGLERVLVCVGDVASKLVDPSNHAVAPIMGDAGAAALVCAGESESWFDLYSDGAGERALMIPNSGLRRSPEDEGKAPLMAMDGAAVFNFTLKRVPALVRDTLAFAGKSPEVIDYFVCHQPNKYILFNTQKRLGLDESRLPSRTQSVYGNQNAASIPGTISGFLADAYSQRRLVSLLAGFGIGLSWAGAVVETDRIYAPPTFLWPDAS